MTGIRIRFTAAFKIIAVGQATVPTPAALPMIVGKIFTAAMAFGHSLIQPTLTMLMPNIKAAA